ncbi:MAG: ABC transporter ATP-binding protein [Sutterella parvirubra]|uniref:Lipoprotein releasing system, ATP-binding protein n=1 Tax=Sutterella parvirubra YIT 11816 TaxID=762967 RepID=H3KEA9_9BURK|nr:ABC transporter ATP-binding protein [Sutterella parvirubra]EHY31544.1 lipoprotein releasing system, ATP-binding protein [Sutterella parvirubra YIT 11816]MCI7708989.1 ABC transporter ATP-binding protein [Sutterella parvirubra]MDR3770320.1 ABC transporter ATP-binding protein [Sutterella sp.]MDY5202298.1 ABC transporter ATP-binding protein [Sutterella parvirubra]
MMTAPLIDVKRVGKRYERGGRPFWAVKGATLTVSEGEFVTLLGRSGSGKSTLLNMVVGLLAPTEGTVTLCGQALAGMSDEAASALRNRAVGFVPQGAGVLSTLTVLDNVRLPAYLSAGVREEEGRALELLEAVGLKELANQYPSALSGGELRRVAIARALMNRPKVIVADEPTSSLDADNAAMVVDIFKKLARGGTGVLMVTHDTSSIEQSDRLFDMVGGVLSPHEA